MSQTHSAARVIEGIRGGQEYAELFGFPPRLLDGVERQAFERYKAGRYADAETLLRGVVVADSRRYYPLLLLAEVLLKQGDPADARAAIEQAFALEPDDPSVRLKFAETLVRSGDAGDARPHLDFVLAHTEPHRPHHLRAKMMLQRLDA